MTQKQNALYLVNIRIEKEQEIKLIKWTTNTEHIVIKRWSVKMTLYDKDEMRLAEKNTVDCVMRETQNIKTRPKSTRELLYGCGIDSMD